MLCSHVKPEGRECSNPSRSTVLDQMSALRLILLSEEPHGLLRDADSTPEVDLEDLSRKVLWRGFGLSCERVSGVIEHHVYASECFFGLRERGFDLSVVGHVNLRQNQLCGAVFGVEVSENRRISKCRDDSVPAFEGITRRLKAKAGRGTSHWRGCDE